MVTATRRAPRMIAVVAACAAMGACTFPEVPIDPGDAQMVVHVILDPSLNDQLVRIGYTDGAYPNGPHPTSSVTVTTPDGVVMTATSGRIRLSDYGVTLKPGATYSLRATSSAGHIVTGTTTIPDASPVSLTPPTQAFNRLSDTLRMSVPGVPGAASFELDVDRSFSGGLNTYLSSIYHTFSSGAITLAGTAATPLENTPLFEAGTMTVVALCAVDANYYEYYRVLSDPFAGAAPSRLSGGLGVFGAIVTVSVRRLDVK